MTIETLEPKLLGHGTLLFDEILEALFDRVPRTVFVDLHGWLRCSFVSRTTGAKGPAVVKQPSSSIRCRVFLDLTPEENQLIRAFEEFAGGYDEVRGYAYEVESQEQHYVYFYAASDERVSQLKPFWSEQYFRVTWLHHYVTDRIPKWRAEYERTLALSGNGSHSSQPTLERTSP